MSVDAFAEPTVRRSIDPVAPTGEPGSSDAADEYAVPTRAASIRQVALSYQRFRQRPGTNASVDEWTRTLSADARPDAGLFRDLYRADPRSADRVADAVTSLPRVGDRLLGFELVEQLGQGAFAIVFLARQGDLAGRPAVLKVSADFTGESQTLAQLQHTNIVPIYSAHRAGEFQVLCMPYCGSTTLADVYRSLEGMPSLPASGRGLISTLKPHRVATVAIERAAGGNSSPEVDFSAEEPQTVPPHDEGRLGTLRMLGRFSYVDAVLWMGGRLASGLAHAHDRGIVHRDLKPANILLTDDGEPMLLDFNLSDDPLFGGAKAGIGGTIPYMAPEQLAAFGGQNRQVDARSDLFAFGVILYELLTRRHPYPPRGRPTPDNLKTMVRDRSGLPPRLRRWNPAVSPAAEAIVRRCLEADPAKRYQSARDLKEDIERQLAHQPLRHTPEPLTVERLAKWRRRHPTITSAASMATAAAMMLAALGAGVVVRGQRIDRLQAEDGLRRTMDDVHSAQALLFDRNAGSARRDAGIELCRAALDRFGVLGNPAWRESPAVRPLSAQERDRLSDHVADLLFLLADVARQRAASSTGDSRLDATVRDALDANTLALDCYAVRGAPRSLWLQRAELAKLAGLDDEQRRAERESLAAPARPDKDSFLAAYANYTGGRYREALPLLRRATLDVPQSFVAWFARGLCHYELLQDSDAVACFNCCVALRPDFPWSWFNRGLALRRQRQFGPARDDFDKFIALQPDNPRGHINRAIAAEGLNDHAAARADLTEALALAERQQAPLTSIYFLRAAVRARTNDLDGARADQSEGMSRQPTDEAGFIDRGLARVESDPKGALADFDEALRINPLSFDGLQNKAAILSDKFGRDGDSQAVMDRAVRLYPDSVLARGGRGVLLARRGDRTRAVQDAEAALLLDASPPTLYQVACIYALTSKQRVEDRVQALQLLSEALKKGYGLNLVADDRDFDPIRDLPEFKAVVSAAHLVAQASASSEERP